MRGARERHDRGVSGLCPARRVFFDGRVPGPRAVARGPAARPLRSPRKEEFRMNRGMVARGCAVALAMAGVLLVARTAGAQYLAPALDRPGFDRRPTQPSLRLLTLGGLSLAIPDENNEINLWDFGGSTLGLFSDR